MNIYNKKNLIPKISLSLITISKSLEFLYFSCLLSYITYFNLDKCPSCDFITSSVLLIAFLTLFFCSLVVLFSSTILLNSKSSLTMAALYNYI